MVNLLYAAAFERERTRLVEIAQSQVRLIEAVARFDTAHSQEDHLEGSFGATLSQIRDAHLNSELAEPMRLALKGRSGTVIGLDYRGAVVLAAHEPVTEINLGIVAKIDLAEIRAPFIKAGMIAAGSAVLLIIFGAALFLRITNPLIRRLEESEAKTRTRLKA